MKKMLIFVVCIIFNLVSYAQNYNFNGSISREVLENYLDRSISMPSLSDIEGDGFPNEAEREAARVEDIEMLDIIGAKFIGRVAGWWENGWGQATHEIFLSKVEQNVSEIKTNDPQAICQGSVFEYVSSTIETFVIPQRVWDEFNMDPVPTNYRLNYESMLYPEPASDYQIYGRPMTAKERGTIPDITQLTTQMWFYYMATSFIERGCEAIHFGQAEIMNRRDVGNEKYWELVNRIRNFAASWNRGVVICDAHVSPGMYYEPLLNISIQEWQEYTYSEDSNKQLLWDFHSGRMRYDKVESECQPDLQPVILNPKPNEGLYQRSLSGINPQGWLATGGNPYLVELDHSIGAGNQVGCGVNEHLYGWDEISWFASQSPDYRNEVLKYSYYKIKCMDKNGHLEMPGRRKVRLNPPPTIRTMYRVHLNEGNQQETIQQIWEGNFSSPQSWVRKDFSDSYVVDSPQPGIARKDLTIVGDNRMYYIGNDQRIHGYIKDNNGVWRTVSPSFSAGNIESQQKAAGDLVANPSGTYLYYRGTDGFFYQFEINNDWSYTYSALPTFFASPMEEQNIRAVGSLICPTDNRLYYIARELTNQGKKRIHGFIKWGSTWRTTSPSWAAHGNGQHINTQELAAGGLVANPSGTYLYYRGENDFFYRYKINGNWSYTYSEMPTNSAMEEQNLRAAGSLISPTNDRLYYIARELTNQGKKRIHGFIKWGSTWRTTSPSWVAHGNGQHINTQEVGNNENSKLVSSQDNQILSYLGEDSELHGFEINSNWDYSYFNFNKTPSNKKPRESLVFGGENKLFYIASISGDDKVHFFEYTDDHCENQAVQNFEPECCIYRPSAHSGGQVVISKGQIREELHEKAEIKKKDFNLQLYPNPCSENHVNLLITGLDSGTRIDMIVSDLQGKTYLKTGTEANHSSIQLDTQNLPNGFYVVYIKSNDLTKAAKLIISK